jgi:uncharacterized integral membrane protein (TIGR00697 family)
VRRFRYLDLITAAFVGVLLISNTVSTKILVLGSFTFDGGTILFPVSYIFGDILTEVYGYRRSRRVIWTGFFAAAAMALVYALVDFLPPANGWENETAYEAIFRPIYRIVPASLIAYFSGEFSNSYVLARMKILTKGRWLWTRTVGSTLVGEGVDTLLFVVIAFWRELSLGLLSSVLISNYLFKVGFEVAITPLTYWIVNTLKRAEGEDYYDYGTDFNPFALRGTGQG